MTAPDQGGAPSAALNSLYRLPVQMLGDLVAPRALERLLQDAAQARGTTTQDLNASVLEDILKREVFKRLQLSVPAPLAKKRVSEVLTELIKTTGERVQPSPHGASLLELDEQARKFALYFDWPETQRLRSVLGVARQEEGQGRNVAALVQEGRELIAQMERRLQEGLVAQAQDLAELRAAFGRVQGLGNREVRRLENLIEQIDESHKQEVLLPGEVERARDITFKLRKLLESSVVQQVSPDAKVTAILDPQAQARVLELEQQHVAQQLATIGRDYAGLLLARPDLQGRQNRLRVLQQTGTLPAEAVDAWREELKVIRETVLAEQRTEFRALEQDLAQLATGLDMGANVRVLLDTTHHTLDTGQLATDELRELRALRDDLAAGVINEERATTQRELLDIERSARKIPAASRDLAPLLAQAQEQASTGQTIDLDALWRVLERHMGAAAQEREDFDTRADHVIHEYDAVRHLAGETTQRLGRLAETLRAQRRLGPMSLEARERYAQALADAEALLGEARAEYRAAQEVTATFGQEALSGLLGVFDVAGEPVPPPAAALSAARPVPARPEVETEAFQFNFSDPEEEVFEVQGGVLLSGPQDRDRSPLTTLLWQADELRITQLSMQSGTHTWEAQRDPDGRWRVTRSSL